MKNARISDIIKALKGENKKERTVKCIDIETGKTVPYEDNDEAIADKLRTGKKFALFATVNGAPSKVVLIANDEANVRNNTLNCTATDAVDADGINFAKKKPLGIVRFFHGIAKKLGGKGFDSCINYERAQAKLQTLNAVLAERTGELKYAAPKFPAESDEAVENIKSVENVKTVKNVKTEDKTVSAAPEKAAEQPRKPQQNRVRPEPVKAEPEVKAPEKVYPPTENSSFASDFRYYRNLYQRMEKEVEDSKSADGPFYGEAFREAYPELKVESYVKNATTYDVRDVLLNGVRAKMEACRFADDRQSGVKGNSYTYSVGSLSPMHLYEIREAQLAASAIKHGNNAMLNRIYPGNKTLQEILCENKYEWKPTETEVKGLFGARGAYNISKQNAELIAKAQQSEYTLPAEQPEAQKAQPQAAEPKL